MEVSVIIPVYNTATHIKKTIESTILQEEVREILVIDDGSTDNSVYIVKTLAQKYPIIKLLQHPNNKNHGPATSRNLGLKNASYSFIAFLDADDFYLPNRFKKAKEVFKNDTAVDGVYEAIDLQYQPNIINKEEHGLLFNGKRLHTITKNNIPPEDLFESFLTEKIGWFHLNGLTLKKDIIHKIGWFNSNLMQSEDIDFMLRACLHSNLYPGSLDMAVGTRVFHSSNITHNTTQKDKGFNLLGNIWLARMLNAKWSKKVNFSIYKMAVSSFNYNPASPLLKPLKYFVKSLYGIFLLFRYPKLIGKLFFS